MVIAALLLSGCFSEDGPEYDIPARKQFARAQLELDADGSPVILAEVVLNYGTKAKLGKYDPKYRSLNTETFVYTGGNGVWKGQGFRNLQTWFDGSSFLARNGKGEIQPMVWNRGKLSLYARSGGDWIVTATNEADPSGASRNFNPRGFLTYYAPSSIIEGDSAWRSISPDYQNYSVALVSNHGDRVVLDSQMVFSPMTSVHGKDVDLIVGFGQNLENRLQISAGLYAYILGRDPSGPKPRRQLLLANTNFNNFNNAIVAKVLGEDRFYFNLSPDSLAEFAIRGKDVVRLENLATPFEAITDTGPPSYRYYPTLASVGPDRCVHLLSPIEHRNDTSGYVPSLSGYLHTSSCHAGGDTLALPEETGRSDRTNVTGSELHFTEDGRLLILFSIVDEGAFHSPSEQTIGPSWLYLAKSAADGKWEWEKVAEY